MGAFRESELLSRRTLMASAPFAVAAATWGWITLPEHATNVRMQMNLHQKLTAFTKTPPTDCTIASIFVPNSPKSALLVFALDTPQKDTPTKDDTTTNPLRAAAANQLNRTVASTAKIFGIDTITGAHLSDFIATTFNQCLEAESKGPAAPPSNALNNERLRKAALRERLANDPTCKAAWYSFQKGHPLKVAAVDSLTLLAAKQDPSVINFQRHTTLLERAATLGSATIALWPWQLFGALQNAATELNSATLIITVTPHALRQLYRRPARKLQPRPEVVDKPELA